MDGSHRDDDVVPPPSQDPATIESIVVLLFVAGMPPVMHPEKQFNRFAGIEDTEGQGIFSTPVLREVKQRDPGIPVRRQPNLGGVFPCPYGIPHSPQTLGIRPTPQLETMLEPRQQGKFPLGLIFVNEGAGEGNQADGGDYTCCYSGEDDCRSIVSRYANLPDKHQPSSCQIPEEIIPANRAAARPQLCDLYPHTDQNHQHQTQAYSGNAGQRLREEVIIDENCKQGEEDDMAKIPELVERSCALVGRAAYKKKGKDQQSTGNDNESRPRMSFIFSAHYLLPAIRLDCFFSPAVSTFLDSTAISPLSSRPSPAVISTFPRCHLDRYGEISCQEERYFSLWLEMTEKNVSSILPTNNLIMLQESPNLTFSLSKTMQIRTSSFHCFLLVASLIVSTTLATLSAPHPAQATAVQKPVLARHIQWTGTSWFGSPMVHNLGGDSRKIIGTFYNIIVWNGNGDELDRVDLGSRVYAPAVVADLEGDGVYEIIAGSGDRVVAYEWRNNQLSQKIGWPASVCSAGQCPEVRGLAAGDLDHNGSIEVVATTTQTQPDGAQVFVFNPDGSLYQPPGLSFKAWPRYNTATGEGNDADVNGPGNHGYGCYGLNVGIGNLDDDPEEEIVITFDNHQINVFHHTGVSLPASPYFTNRSPTYLGNRLNWGQFIRWFDAEIEYNHYNLHTGTWPTPIRQKWLQWTQSPPSVADINGDQHNEVVAIANVEMGEPYDTKHHSIMVLEGNWGSGDRSARRLAGWESLPSSGYPLGRTGYPPSNPPAPTIVDINGDSKPEILYAAHDGYIYCTSSQAKRLWRYDIRHGRSLMYASEITVADLNRDGAPELIFTTYGLPESISPLPSGYLTILDNQGRVLHDLQLPVQGTNGNGKGAPAAPTIMDVDGNGNLEILVQTFGAGFFIYTVPGSAENLLLWPTARGNFLRDGRPGSGGNGRIMPPIFLLLDD